MPEATYEELCYWNTRTYGTAARVPGWLLRGLVSVACLATPCTNWMVPLAFRWIRRDIWVRW